MWNFSELFYRNQGQENSGSTWPRRRRPGRGPLAAAGRPEAGRSFQVEARFDLRSTQLGNQVSPAVSAITRESASFHTMALATRVGPGGEDGVGDGLGERVKPARIRAETQRERL
jgi:hypothetical protein